MAAWYRQEELDAAVKSRYGERAHPLALLANGARERFRDVVSKLWDKVGAIVSVGRYRSYRVKFSSRVVLWRNRRLIRR